MKRYSLRHFIRYTLRALILLFPFCASFNTSLATGIGSVLILDGDGDEVRVEHAQSLVMTDALTIETWIYPLGPGSDGRGIIVNKEGEYELARFDDGSIRFAVSNEDPGWNWIDTDFVVPEGTWAHLAFTYSANAQTFQLFANGMLVFSRAGTGEIGDVYETHNYFKIGARREGVRRFFDGRIDEVRVWNIVRTEAEIQATMNTSLQGNEPGLVGYWNFDNGTANDLSDHGNHGTLRGNAAIVPSTTTPTVGDNTASSTTAAQVEISAVPSASNPAVGDTIEISINIAGASNVGGYEFTLTFNPTQLQYITVENSDFLPAGAFAFPPTVGNGSVGLAALALTGTGEGSGTLAVATFKVLAETETTVGFGDVTIGDSAAQPLAIASVTDATINSAASGTPTTPDTPTIPDTPPPPDTPTTSAENVLVTGVKISAVPSVVNPAVGDTIEVSINIAGASNVGGYEFTLTFNSTQLQYISIENSDFLPAGAFAFPPTVGNGSVGLAALALTGTGEGNGTLAVATFKVLAETETTVGFGNVTIGDSAAQPLEIESITGATITPTTSGTPTTPPTTPDTPITPEPPTTSGENVFVTGVKISAVPNANNPAVGDTIQISINIAGASNVAGYELTLTFNPTQLQYISIENSDFLPAGAFATSPIVESGSVKFAAAAVTGTGEGDGTLAVATFKVLADTETTIGLEEVVIGDQTAQPIEIASITGVTITPTTSSTPTTPPTTPDAPIITPEPPTTSGENILVAGVRISAVSSISNPAVGDTIEVSINIAGASNVGGYEFTLTFNPTELQYISIENADYLPPGAFVPELEVENDSVKLAAVALTGTGEGDGTLAVATFKVLVDTETTVRFEDVVIGDQMAQPLGIASVTGATINRAAPTADAEVEYLLSIPAGISLIHVPLKVTAVDGVPKTITSITDLYDALGGIYTVNVLITYDAQNQEWHSYFSPLDKGTPGDKALTDDTGILAGMIVPVSIRLRGKALGTNGSSTITLNQGLNLVGLPLRDSCITRVSDLFALDGIGGNVPVIILTDDGEFKAVGRAGDPGDIEITGGQSFMMTAQHAATVIIYGDGWTNIR